MITPSELDLITAIAGVATTIAGIATTLLVAFAVWELRLSHKHKIAEFEETLDEQYRAISLALPVDVLTGGMPKDHESNSVREHIFNWMDLSNNEAYYRAKGRISTHTWESWSNGIKMLLGMPAFKENYEELIGKSGFSYLARLVDENFENDPITWYK